MKKKQIISLLILILFSSSISTISTGLKINEKKDIYIICSETIYVDDDNTEGPWDGTIDYPYQHIGDAIDNSSDGDTIFVFNGTYYENINVDKTILIIGENKNDTIIDGMYNEFLMKIIADNVTISNLKFQNSGGYKNNAGIKIDTKYNLIAQCIFYRTKTAIFIDNTNFNEINTCIFYSNGEGVFINSSSDIKIENCKLTHNAIGFHINNSNQIQIMNCYAHTNGIGFFINESSDIEIEKCAVFNHNDNQGGFFINLCNQISISNCNIYHNGFAIKIAKSKNISIMQSNFVWNGHSAVQIQEDSKDIVVNKCEFADNFRFSIIVRNSNADLSENNIHDSIFGMETEYSQVIARKNYWGSALGPAIFDRKSKDRIFYKFGYIKFFPWSFKRITDAGSNWDIDYDFFPGEINTSRYIKIELTGTDTDNDHVPDWWEEKWGYDPYIWDDHENLDPDSDGLNNMEECFADVWSSNPFHKDIFLEFDWIKAKDENVTNKPSCTLICDMKNVFEKHNITLHVDVGTLGGGEEIIFKQYFSYADIRDLYWDYFLHNDMNNPRKGIFHYGLICDNGVDMGFAIMGWDHVDSFIIPAQFLADRSKQFDRETYIIGGSIHELGHTLGLFVDDHGGNDNIVATKIFTLQWWKYINYKSCMNYWYTYKLIDYSDGTHGNGDFNDWEHFDFSFFKDTHFEWPK